MRRPHSAVLWLALTALLSTGCTAVKRAGMDALFDWTPWPAERVVEDVLYVDGEAADPEKQRLDLFLPEGDGWPTLVFVHGGSWRQGDKDLDVGGREVYGNIGRFYASKGFGVAVISYRLQPAVDWRGQVEDVASAIRWVAREVGGRGGDPGSIFLSGHSAGAQLASYVALADWPLSRDVRRRICGVVAISGAGYDLADEETYELGADPAFYEKTFRADGSDEDWRRRASVTTYLAPGTGAPPFLVFYAEDEHAALHRQAALIHRAVEEAGAPSRLIEVPHVGHRRVVVEFSQEDAVLASPVVDFIEAHRGCRSAPAAAAAL